MSTIVRDTEVTTLMKKNFRDKTSLSRKCATAKTAECRMIAFQRFMFRLSTIANRLPVVGVVSIPFGIYPTSGGNVNESIGGFGQNHENLKSLHIMRLRIQCLL